MNTVTRALSSERTRRCLAVVAIVGLVSLAAVSWWSGHRLPKGPFKAGVRNLEPFYFVQPGLPVRGLSVEVVGEAARRLGIALEWVEISESSEDALTAGRIDLWTTMTILPDRNPQVRVTEPWLYSDYFLLYRAESRIRDVADVTRRPVAFVPSRVGLKLVERFLSHARLLQEMKPAAVLADVCSGKADAGVLEARESQALLLKRPAGCETTALGYTRIEGARLQIGIASLPRLAAVAEALRAEIGRMGEDGSLARVTSRWTFVTTNETSAVYGIQEERRKLRWSVIGIGLLSTALMLSFWQIHRVRAAGRLAEQATRSLRNYARHQERYRVLFERSLAGVFRTNLEGRILDCNEAFARILGFDSREEVLATSAWDKYPEAEQRRAYLTQLKDKGSLTNFELLVKRRDGSPAWLLESVTLIPDESGERQELEGTVLDITRLRELEEQYRQAQKLESVGRLAGGVAHDFNNLLTAINGYSELLSSQLESESHLKEYAEEIQKAGIRAASLTQQLLAFSRKQLLQPEILSLNRIVEDIQKMLGRLIGEDVELVTSLDPSLWPIKADPGQIQQVIMNLAVNARDAMPQGGRLALKTENIYLEQPPVSPAPGFKPGSYVLLKVSDSGHGMDDETLRHLFEPFFTTKGQGKGTGLGLSTVYGIISQSDGYVRVSSQPGRGTSFSVYFPRATGETGRQDTESSVVSQRASETVLLAEDQEEVRRLAEQVLMRQGYRVLAAACGDEALRLFRAFDGFIDLLITDVVMPGMSGRHLADQLRALSPKTHVLFMSGYTDDFVVHQGVLDDDVEFIQKPFSPTDLARKVSTVLSRAPERAGV
jgi:PAS domain S-box-containing protein